MPLTTNRNFFNPIQAEFHVRRLPNVNFFCQRVSIPGMRTKAPVQENPFTNIKHPGDQLYFDELEVTFKVDEYLENYLEITDWLTKTGFPEDFAQYRRVMDPQWVGDEVTSDGSILFLDSKANPRLEVQVMTLFPVEISPIVVDTTAEDIGYLTATAKFAYTLYKIVRTATSDAV